MSILALIQSIQDYECLLVQVDERLQQRFKVLSLRWLRPTLAGLEERFQWFRDGLVVRKELYNERTKHFVMILFRAIIEIEIEVSSVGIWSLPQNMLQHRGAEDGFP